MTCATCGKPRHAGCPCWGGGKMYTVPVMGAPPVHTCSTCAHWLADDPATRYRADCGLGELTKPEEWQCCPRWSARAAPQEQSGCRG